MRKIMLPAITIGSFFLLWKMLRLVSLEMIRRNASQLDRGLAAMGFIVAFMLLIFVPMSLSERPDDRQRQDTAP